MNRLFAELARRNVFRVAGVYAVVGWLLAQVATTLEEALGLPAWFDGLIVALLLLGFPLALILAWAFELTPEGVVRTEAVPAGESITAQTGRKLDYAIVVGLVLLGAFLLWQQVSRELSSTPAADAGAAETVSAASIAVLPFDDLSPGGDQGYFSDGIAEEILNVLVGVRGLEVASRTSSFQFKGQNLGIPAIAQSLKVQHVVEGSVRKSGDTIRVTAQLIDARNDRHLWSDVYQRPLTAETIFQIQDEIARAIVTALGDTLGMDDIEPVEVIPATQNLSAYDLYLRARPLFVSRVGLDAADAYLVEALQQDPDYADAWEMHAALQMLKYEYGYTDEPLDDAVARSIEFARRALAIDPDSSTALAVIAKVQGDAAQTLSRPGTIASNFADFDRALGIDPRNTEALNWRGLRYFAVGYLDAALRDFQACLRFEPYYQPCVENNFTVLASMGRDDDALEAYIQALDTSSAKVQYAHLPLLVRKNMEVAFKSATNSSGMLFGWRRHAELWEAYKHPELDHSELIASINDYLGVKEGAYSQLAAYVTNPIGMGWRTPEPLVLWDAAMARYRKTDAFKAWIRDAGVYDYWQVAGYPPQCRPRGKDDFECD